MVEIELKRAYPKVDMSRLTSIMTTLVSFVWNHCDAAALQVAIETTHLSSYSLCIEQKSARVLVTDHSQFDTRQLSEGPCKDNTVIVRSRGAAYG